MKKSTFLFIFLLFSLKQFSQNILQGKILYNENNKDIPLEGATVKWLNTNKGTISDEDGIFKLESALGEDFIEISFLGFETDTVYIKNKKNITHFLKISQENTLDEVIISKRKRSAQRTYLMPQNIVKISEDELLKAACCNLSESFETNPAVDVNHSDALTGTKQIKMLGLKSPYILITEENIPMVRGASQTYGLTFIPGTWIESIQITKGMGSVINGYESIVGQINAELKNH